MKTNPILQQSWDDIAFLHWRVPHHVVRACVPAPLDIDTFAGQSWVSIIPFAMRNIRVRGLPRVPGAHTLLECNVRTYVTLGGVAGIWFMRLDANHALASWIGRAIASLPYAYARIEQQTSAETIRYICSYDSVVFDASMTATGPSFEATPGTLDHWLCERYYLYTTRGKTLYRGTVAHPPWCLREAHCTIRHNTLMWRHLQWKPPAAPELVHRATCVDVQLFSYNAIDRICHSSAVPYSVPKE